MGVSERCSMTWEKAKLRWRKMFQGKIYTISCDQLGVAPTKEASYQAANAWWTKKLAELQGHPVPYFDRPILHESIARPDPLSDTDWLIESARRHGVIIPPTLDPAVKAILFGQTRLARDVDSVVVPAEKTVAGLVRAWLSQKEVEMKAGQLAPKRFDNLKYDMRFIEEAMGSSVALEEINEQTVDGVYSYFLAKIADGKMARETAKTRWGLFRGLIRFGWSRRLFDLPRNLEEKSITSPPMSVPTWPIKDVRATIAASVGQLRLHLLLMINAGMYGKDVSDLQDDEVDWIEGTITRRRSKTQKSKDTPSVTYRLWPETFELLKKFRSGSSTVLLTGDGRPWVRAELQPAGKILQCDGIARNFRRLIASHNEKNPKNLLFARPLKELRKTSSSLLDSHPEFGRYAQFFLGHSPRSVAEKHYVKPSQERFDEAVLWLGEQYGFLQEKD